MNIDVNDNQKCFICGPKSDIGLKAKFSVDPTKNSAKTEVFIGEEFQGWQGIVHGGIIAALLDEISFYACSAISMQMVTAELNIKYKKPLPVNSTVKVYGVMVKQSRNILSVEATLSCNEVVIATAQTKMFVLKTS